MKTTAILSFLFVSCLSFASCSDADEQPIEQEKYVKEIIAYIYDFEEDADSESTRTSYIFGDQGCSASWTLGDTLGIYPIGGDQVAFPISDGAGSNTAVFDGGAWALRSEYQYASYFPYDADNYKVSEKMIPVSYVNQTQEENNSTTHFSNYDFLAAPPVQPSQNGSVNLGFKRLGAFLKVVMTMPKAGTYTRLTLTSSKGNFVTEGTVDLSAASPSITPTKLSNTVSIKLNDIKVTSDDLTLIVNMMIAPVDLTGSTITIKVMDSEGLIYTNNENHWTRTKPFEANGSVKVSRNLSLSTSEGAQLGVSNWETDGTEKVEVLQ